MDILYELAYLLCQDGTDLKNRDPDYVALRNLEARHFDQIASALGQEEADKLIDIQEDIELIDKLRCFLYGLRLGIALLDQPFAGYQST